MMAFVSSQPCLYSAREKHRVKYNLIVDDKIDFTIFSSTINTHMSNTQAEDIRASCSSVCVEWCLPGEAGEVEGSHSLFFISNKPHLTSTSLLWMAQHYARVIKSKVFSCVLSFWYIHTFSQY